jgi:RimJ/RimL family protein N-acetyltransferase
MAHIDERTFLATAGDEIIVRTAAPDDAARLRAFLWAAAATTDQICTEPDEFPAEDAQERALLQTTWNQPDDIALMALVGGRIVGGRIVGGRIVGSLSFATPKRRRLNHAGFLGMLVAAPWRGKGIGTALLTMLIDWAKAHPTLEKLCLTVLVDNAAAIRLYEKLGFLGEGLRRGQVKHAENRYADELAMGLWVKAHSATSIRNNLP